MSRPVDFEQIWRLAADEELRPKEIATRMGIHSDTVRKWLMIGCQRGVIERVDRGRYRRPGSQEKKRPVQVDDPFVPMLSVNIITGEVVDRRHESEKWRSP